MFHLNSAFLLSSVFDCLSWQMTEKNLQKINDDNQTDNSGGAAGSTSLFLSILSKVTLAREHIFLFWPISSIAHIYIFVYVSHDFPVCT